MTRKQRISLSVAALCIMLILATYMYVSFRGAILGTSVQHRTTVDEKKIISAPVPPSAVPTQTPMSPISSTPTPQPTPPCDQMHLLAGERRTVDGTLVVWQPQLSAVSPMAPPVLVPTPQPATTPPLIVNGDFELGGSHWDSHGNVRFTSEIQGNVSPFGRQMVALGGADGSSTLTANRLSQTLQVPHSKQLQLSFWYAVRTDEDVEGFDEPAFALFANDTMLFQVWANEERGNQTFPFWRHAVVDVSQLASQTVSLSFFAGNTGDDERATTVYLDNLALIEVVLPHADQQSSALSAPQNFQVQHDKDNIYTLSWVAPADTIADNSAHHLSAYDLRYSSSPISESISWQEWFALPQPTYLNHTDLPFSHFPAPQAAATTGVWQAQTNIQSERIYFALRAVDARREFSPLVFTF